MSLKPLIISTIAALFFIGGAILLPGQPGEREPVQEGTNVLLENGKQIIEIRAKGGYSPRVTTADANLPTVIRVKTQGTFDCSAALTIPSLNYRTMLTPSGEVEIGVPPQPGGSTLQGLCAMGMYNFAINFK